MTLALEKCPTHSGEKSLQLAFECPDHVNPWSLKDDYCRVPRYDVSPKSGYIWRFHLSQLEGEATYNRSLSYHFQNHDYEIKEGTKCNRIWIKSDEVDDVDEL